MVALSKLITPPVPLWAVYVDWDWNPSFDRIAWLEPTLHMWDSTQEIQLAFYTQSNLRRNLEHGIPLHQQLGKIGELGGWLDEARKGDVGERRSLKRYMKRYLASSEGLYSRSVYGVLLGISTEGPATETERAKWASRAWMWGELAEEIEEEAEVRREAHRRRRQEKKAQLTEQEPHP